MIFRNIKAKLSICTTLFKSKRQHSDELKEELHPSGMSDSCVKELKKFTPPMSNVRMIEICNHCLTGSTTIPNCRNCSNLM